MSSKPIAGDGSSQAGQKGGPADPAREAGARADNERLQRSVEESVPDPEQLPGAAHDNPMSRHVRAIAKGREPGPGGSAFEGGDKDER